MFGLDLSLTILLLFCLLCACAFEFINGFHDTANAVATVIYTNSLKPVVAVVWSGICNGIGVFMGLFVGFKVAMGIINLLPAESLTDPNVYHGVAMILALLFTAIIWNLGTWYYGIPCSSSHTMIGSILGVGLAYSFLPEAAGAGVNWHKASEIGISLLISPLLGFGLTFLMMKILKLTVNDPTLFKKPHKGNVPPFWIRAVLIFTCTGVSYSHGSNDGQKGIGLVMLILIVVVPARFALDHTKSPQDINKHRSIIENVLSKADTNTLDSKHKNMLVAARSELHEIEMLLGKIQLTENLPDSRHFQVRKDILLIARNLEKIMEDNPAFLPADEQKRLKSEIQLLREYTDYSPMWVIVLISLCLGIGTMVGWKRIVVTIGEKIGKSHLTYAQGASSELVAAGTIGIASATGLPVSTTHILSSGIAGSMVEASGTKNLQPKTLQSIVMAWVLTLPVSIGLSFALFFLFRAIL